jgi:hypothetical protein
MATFLETAEAPQFGELWESPIDGQNFYLVERKFPRFDRMVCLMENLKGYHHYFVFPVKY